MGDPIEPEKSEGQKNLELEKSKDDKKEENKKKEENNNRGGGIPG